MYTVCLLELPGTVVLRNGYGWALRTQCIIVVTTSMVVMMMMMMMMMIIWQSHLMYCYWCGCNLSMPILAEWSHTGQRVHCGSLRIILQRCVICSSSLWLVRLFRLQASHQPRVRVRSHWHKYKSRYPCPGYSKQEFARIPMAAFTLIQVHYEFDFHSYWSFRVGLVSRQPVQVSM